MLPPSTERENPMLRRPVNAEERLQLRQSYIPKDARLVPGPKGGAAYVYTTASGHIGAMAFWGTAGKPTWHYTYRTADQAHEAVRQFHESLQTNTCDSNARAAKAHVSISDYIRQLRIYSRRRRWRRTRFLLGFHRFGILLERGDCLR